MDLLYLIDFIQYNVLCNYNVCKKEKPCSLTAKLWRPVDFVISENRASHGMSNYISWNVFSNPFEWNQGKGQCYLLSH